MDEEIERLVVGVRADTAGFQRDVAALRGSLETGLGDGADRAGQRVEAALARAVTTGKLGFDDLRRLALSVLDDVARAAVRTALPALLPPGGGGGLAAAAGGAPAAGEIGALAGLATKLLGGLFGLPGRATGGPVSPGAAYVVGERGPELFVPTASGAVVPPIAASPPAAPVRVMPPPMPPREVRVAIRVDARGEDTPRALARSGRQVARAVRAALEG